MAAGRPLFGFISLILLAGAVVLQLFVILSGGITKNPISQVYFLEASTSGIPGARNPSRWTYFAVCGVDGETGRNADCGRPVPAIPFSPPHRTNFDTTDGIPEGFIGTQKFYYLSRFMWVLMLVALLFGAFSLCLGLLALCTRLGAYLSAFNTFMAFGLQAVAAALMTAWTVVGRNTWRSAGHDAKLGTKAFGFTWAAVAAYFLATVLFCLGGTASRHDTYSTSRNRGFFVRRKRSTRSRGSRGSFIDNESGRRVKDDYS